MHTADDREFQIRMQRIEGLLQEIERFPDLAARATAREIVQAILDLHGAGFTRVVEKLTAGGDPGHALLMDLSGDDLVASLLLLYGLHPSPLEDRIAKALDRVRPLLRPYDKDVEVIDLRAGELRLRLTGQQGGCGNTAAALKQAVEEAVEAAAPDLTGLHVEEEAASPVAAFIPVEQLVLRTSRVVEGVPS